jgi:S-adenosylmethionine decarboxylase proenzyme
MREIRVADVRPSGGTNEPGKSGEETCGEAKHYGRHLLVDLVRARHLNDRGIVEEALRDCVAAAGATLVDIRLQQFAKTGGISGVAILAESHMSIHSWPEDGYAALDLFMCGYADPRRALPVLERVFRPEELLVQETLRGAGGGEQTTLPMHADGRSRETMRHVYEQIWIGELWNAGNPAGGRVLAEDFVDHRPIEQFPPDRDGHVAMALDWHRAFPDMTFKIHDVIVEGDKLVARYSAEGTHLGPLSGIEPSGRRVSLTGIDIFRFRDGRLLEWWHNEDIHGLIKQISAQSR